MWLLCTWAQFLCQAPILSLEHVFKKYNMKSKDRGWPSGISALGRRGGRDLCTKRFLHMSDVQLLHLHCLMHCCFGVVCRGHRPIPSYTFRELCFKIQPPHLFIYSIFLKKRSYCTNEAEKNTTTDSCKGSKPPQTHPDRGAPEPCESFRKPSPSMIHSTLLRAKPRDDGKNNLKTIHRFSPLPFPKVFFLLIFDFRRFSQNCTCLGLVGSDRETPANVSASQAPKWFESRSPIRTFFKYGINRPFSKKDYIDLKLYIISKK